ncbi:MAG: MG2 domain-containing protein [Gammaproteobacteria bacterium]|nr:MG2 domain-containing protein [Gammaproteobacteria bacterium]MDH5650306.1 MG2 domain-containing protein [Gammaproteobacteria bacterium]
MIISAKFSKLFSLLFLVTLLLNGCDSKQKDAASSQEERAIWSQYIAGHTNGLVTKKTRLNLQFINEVIPVEKIGQDASTYIDIEPAIPGNITFGTTRDIILLPEKDLQPGQEYRVTFKAKDLPGMPTDLKEYKFHFQVIKADFEVRTTGLSTSDKDNKAMILSGSVTTSDHETGDAIKQLLKAGIENQELAIEWQHSSNGREHTFTINNIRRKDDAQNLTLRWDGSVLGADNKGETIVEIPSLSDFKITRIRTIQDDQQYIMVEFSDRLDNRQNLNGLIRFENVKSSHKVNGNVVKLYPNGAFTGELVVVVNKAVRNIHGARLGKDIKEKIEFATQKPQVRFAGKGVILPDNKALSIPFEAINVNSVQVTAFQVYADNMGQFLQSNTLKEFDSMDRVGRYLWRKTIHLPTLANNKWNRYEIDATELLKKHPGALFRLRLSINRSNSTYTCSEAENNVSVKKEEPLQNQEDLYLKENSGWDGVENYYDNPQSGYNWRDRENPCKDDYYVHGAGGSVKDERNFLASNIGIIAKRDDNGFTHVVTTDLRTSEPMAGVSIDVMNFQNQSIGQMKTDGSGIAKLQVKSTPFYLIARKDKQVGYLKLTRGTVLPVSHFDTDGEKLTKGIKGFIYGERGVWRPGDDIHLTFVLQDKDNVIPAAHPVTLQFFNPKGQMVHSEINNQPVGDFYTFKLKTDSNDITGSWTAKALLGGAVFSKEVKIETVVPNRLKVELEFGKEILSRAEMPLKGKLFGQWLHGATAGGLRADVAVKLSPLNTRFKVFTDYNFDDKTREFKGETFRIFDDQLDKEGNANFDAVITPNEASAGMLNATFTSRVFEEGGAFSSSSTALKFHPYINYVGIKPPKGDQARNMLLTDVKHKLEIASLDHNGNPVALKNIHLSLYKIRWKWWWDKSGESLAEYAQSSYHRKLAEGTVKTDSKGTGNWEFEIKYPDWGRYLVRACDEQGGHCSSQILYVDWPGWAGRAQEQSGAGANVLTFYADKAKYDVGETAVIQLPESTAGRALLSIESGSSIIEQRWINFSKDKTKLELPITSAMSPNAYISITLIQPHQDKQNDRPIRLYGVIPLLVNDPKTRLDPVLVTDDEWKPRKKATVTVTEKNNQGMTYTLAVVDEGLLGLTAFRTPDLHSHFYRKEALGIMTWDLFDNVVGAYGGQLERLLALGGDDSDEEKESKKSRKRFPPVVKFLGPFRLIAGKKNSHEIEIPQYLGSVRVMVVAGQNGAYGKTDKSVYVREPLSLLATVPRVLGPEEDITIPITLFAMHPDVKDVVLEFKADNHFTVKGKATQTLHFDKPGDKPAFLKMKVGAKLGKAKMSFTATSGKFKTASEVFIDVRSANPPDTRLTSLILPPGQTRTVTITPHGLPGTNNVTLETTVMQPLNLEKRLRYLIQYPHGCLEQTTSSVFPQLYLKKLVTLSSQDKQTIDNHIHAGINRLRQYQGSLGGFSYWPGQSGLNSWANTYAGHFLIEAEKQGYHVPPEMMNPWLDFQRSSAQNWVTGGRQSAMEQAYRLYTLALANKPELGAMNRLRESDQLYGIARWQLAAAYKLIGQNDAAKQLVQTSTLDVDDYAEPGSTFGSRLRDQAILLDVLVILGDLDRAVRLADPISKALSAEGWHSTQSVAYALLAMSRFSGVGSEKTLPSFEYAFSKRPFVKVKGTTPVHKSTLDNFPEQGDTVTLKNTGKATMYATLYTTGIAKPEAEESSSHGLEITVDYRDLDNNYLDVERLEQGKDFKATITVRNTSRRLQENLALTHIVPSGWEIINNRLGESGDAAQEIDYRDIRDDRVYTYFNLQPGERKTFTTTLNAAYLGHYYMPGIAVEAMYDVKQHARIRGHWIDVVSKGMQAEKAAPETTHSSPGHAHNEERMRTKQYARHHQSRSAADTTAN